ncbi:MAG: hypothetical protein WDN24_02050 [Sphingomonas sp.]
MICLAAAPFALWRPLVRERRFGVALRAGGAGLAVLAAYALLHLAIYGARWSDYVLLSRGIWLRVRQFRMEGERAARVAGPLVSPIRAGCSPICRGCSSARPGWRSACSARRPASAR